MVHPLNLSVYALQMTILLRMDDKMNRQLTCPVSQTDTSMLLAQELVHFGFINEVNFHHRRREDPIYEKTRKGTGQRERCKQNLITFNYCFSQKNITQKLSYYTNYIF